MTLLRRGRYHFPVSGRGDRSSTPEGEDHPSGRNGRFSSPPKFLGIVLVSILGLSTAFYRLGFKGLWGDEVWQVSWSQQQSLGRTFVRFTIFNDLDRLRHPSDENLPGLVTSIDNSPLHFLWTHLALKLGPSEFWARFPSAFLGAAGVLLLFLLGSKLFGSRAGLMAAALLALAPYHVWYAQDARPYSALACYSLLSLYFFTEILERPSGKAWLGFVAGTTLNLYNHSLAALPFIAELLVSVGLGTIWWLRARSARHRPDLRAERGLRRSLILIWSGLCVSAVIALPVLAKGVVLIKLRGFLPGQNTRFTLTSQFLKVLFSSFGAGNGALLWAFLILSALGLGAALAGRGRAWFGFLTLIWIGLPLAALGIMQPRRPIPLRYFIFIQPLYLLMVARGCHKVMEAAGRFKDRVLPGMPKRKGIRTWGPVGLVLAGVFFVLFPLTAKGYRVEKVNDWSAIGSCLRRQVRPGDVIVGESYIADIMDWCYKKRNGVALVRPGRYSLDELRDLGRNVWYLALDDRPQEGRAALLQRGFESIPHSAYARPGLLPPDYSCGGRLRFPQSEPRMNLYRHEALFEPSLVKFKDLAGSKKWPAHARIDPGDHYDVVLRRPSADSRVVAIRFWDSPGSDLDLYVNDRLIGAIKAGASGGRWLTFRFPLASSDPDTFLLKMANTGSKTCFVSKVEVRNEE